MAMVRKLQITVCLVSMHVFLFSADLLADLPTIAFRLKELPFSRNWLKGFGEPVTGTGGDWFQISSDGIAYFKKGGTQPYLSSEKLEREILREAVYPQSSRIDTFLVLLGRLGAMDPKQFREQIEFRYEDEVKRFFTLSDEAYRARYAGTSLARHLEWDSQKGVWRAKTRLTDMFSREYDLTNEYLKELQKAIQTTHARLEQKRRDEIARYNQANPNKATLVVRGSPQTDARDGLHEKVMKAVEASGLMREVRRGIEEMLYKKLDAMSAEVRDKSDDFGSRLDERLSFRRQEDNRITVRREIRLPLVFGNQASGELPKVELKLKLMVTGNLSVRVGENERQVRPGENLLSDLNLTVEIANFSATVEGAELVNTDGGANVPWKEAEGLKVYFATHTGVPLQMKIPHIRVSVPPHGSRYEIRLSPGEVETNFSDLGISHYEDRRSGAVYDSLKQILLRNPRFFLTPIQTVIGEPMIEKRLAEETKKLEESLGREPVHDYILFDTAGKHKTLIFSKWLESTYGLSQEAFEGKPVESRRRYLEMFKQQLFAEDRRYDLFGKLRVTMNRGIRSRRIGPKQDPLRPARLDLGGFELTKSDDRGFEIELSEVAYRAAGSDRSALTGRDKLKGVFRPRGDRPLEVRDTTRAYFEDGKIVLDYTRDDSEVNFSQAGYMSDVRLETGGETIVLERKPDAAFEIRRSLYRPDRSVALLRQFFSETEYGRQVRHAMDAAVGRVLGAVVSQILPIHSVSKWDSADTFDGELEFRSKPDRPSHKKRPARLPRSDRRASSARFSERP